MATTGLVVRVQVERRFFTGMAVAMLLFVFVGFAPTYFLYPIIGAEPVRGSAPLTPLVHLHAAVSSAWMVFLILQTGLILGRQHAYHMRNGLIGGVLAIAIVVIGIAVALYSARVGRTPPGWTPTGFLTIPFASVTLFGGFIAAALAFRRRVDIHKRLMLIGTMALLVPAGARFSNHFLTGIIPGGPIGGMILSDLFLAALAVHDVRTRGRVHSATLWGGAAMLLSQPLRVALGETEIWNRFAASLIG